MQNERYGPSPRALKIIKDFTENSPIILPTPEAMCLAFLVNKEFMDDEVRIETLKGGLDTAIAAGDVQREKIKELTNALYSIIHKCKHLDGPDLKAVVRLIANCALKRR